jgi:hypothetical protein
MVKDIHHSLSASVAQGSMMMSNYMRLSYARQQQPLRSFLFNKITRTFDKIEDEKAKGPLAQNKSHGSISIPCYWSADNP